jgi:hypothetical protein
MDIIYKQDKGLLAQDLANLRQEYLKKVVVWLTCTCRICCLLGPRGRVLHAKLLGQLLGKNVCDPPHKSARILGLYLRQRKLSGEEPVGKLF